MGFSADNRLKLDLYKVSHHGSKFNTTLELLNLLDCTRFAFSTDGTRNDHPHPETIAKILVNDPLRPKTLYFNFRQDHALRWDKADLKAKWRYKCCFPADGTSGLTIEIGTQSVDI
ncbi:hypothetical protein AJ88_23715 [Mesorhizobium amorphae CCBAU 01583]|nr:hypothetical protein AJ88_23715 [Mesorhizobium amorphae CCBAU 01583]